jgi:hypothetical protein
VDSLNKFCSTTSPLLLLVSTIELSLILCLDTDNHSFFATQSRVPNKLKFDFGVVNLGILVAIDSSSFF